MSGVRKCRPQVCSRLSIGTRTHVSEVRDSATHMRMVRACLVPAQMHSRLHGTSRAAAARYCKGLLMWQLLGCHKLWLLTSERALDMNGSWRCHSSRSASTEKQL